MGGKSSSVGAVLGMTAGALLALPTGGVSIGVGAAIGGAAGGSVGSIKDTSDMNKAVKSAKADASARDAKALKDMMDAQESASQQARNAIDNRRRMATQTVFTNPMGIAEQASSAKKSLLGL